MNVTNLTGTTSIWQSPYSSPVQVILWTVALILSLETIIGNAMVIIAYKLERSISKQVSNRYIVSLAISDLIIGIEGFPFFTVYVVNGDRWPLGVIACETWLFLDYTLCLVSILTVLLITADRYLSVCHTAKYLKWQSPTKTQMLIVGSWVIPALIFGVMIYGWSMISGSTEGNAAYENGECFAPFLSNPYVNMGMYVAYYWTTLIAMLILYKGIHQAAKNLEKKAKAKEHRHIALLLTQRLGTQVGVSLMLQSRRHDSLPTEAIRDSGYHTNNQLSVGGGNNSDGATGDAIEMNNESGFPKDQNIRRTRLNSAKKRHQLLRSVKSASIATNTINSPDSDVRSNKFQFTLASPSDANQDGKHSDSASIIFRQHSRKSQHRRSQQMLKSTENLSECNQIVNVTDENGEVTTTIECGNTVVEEATGVSRFFAGIRNFFKRHAPSASANHTYSRSRSSSMSSTCSSSSETSHLRRKKSTTLPAVTVTRDQAPRSSIVSFSRQNRDKSDPFLSTLNVSRKVSTISNFTKDTRDRVLQSLFSPIIAFNRGRKRTKAERRAHKAFRTITFIVGFFAILWSPYYVVATIYGFCKGQCIPPLLYNLSYYMCYLNSSGNPFAYALANRQFRSAFLRILRGNFNRVS